MGFRNTTRQAAMAVPIAVALRALLASQDFGTHHRATSFVMWVCSMIVGMAMRKISENAAHNPP